MPSHDHSSVLSASLSSPCLPPFPPKSLSPMDPRDVIIAMAMEAVLEMKRQEIRRMRELLRARQVALQEKDNDRAMLTRKKQDMLAKEAAKKKLVDDFTVFLEAIEGNDMEKAPQNFDEKAMMDAIQTMIDGDEGVDSGDN